MKTFFNRLLTLGAFALVVASSSCKKDGTIVTATNGTGGTLTASSTTPVLNKLKLTDASSIITFNFTQANYGYQSAVTNTLQIDAASDNWANPYTVALGTNVLTQSYNTSDFNSIILKLGIKGGVAGQVNVRIKSAIGTNTFVYTNVVALTVTPFNLVSYVYIPGAYQGWNPATADSLQSATGNGIYTGIINYVGTDFHFKITPAKKWDVAYGDAGSGKISTSGGDISAPGAGQYFVTVDLNANTITFATPANYYSVIGDAAIDWNTDVDMKFNNGTLNWELTRAFVSTGGFKVRLNHAWATSWGFLSTPDGATLTSNNGGNMSVSSTGTYKLVFTPTYGTDGKPVTTATYTLVKQ